MSKQLFFIKFPIFFPLIYGFILYFFPQYATALLFITILLLAETHFCAPWPFFLLNSNYENIKNDKLKLFILPMLIVIFSLLGFFLVKSFFLMIFFAANVYHVTRQSFGVCKLYCKEVNEIKYQENFIYFFNSLFFIIAFFRFYIPIITEDKLLMLNIAVLLLFSLVSFIYIAKYKFTEKFLTFVTGCIIFFPVCFVDNPVHSIIMGVTMHYTQYLYLTHHVVRERSISTNMQIGQKIGMGKFFYKFAIIIFLYSIVMTGFSLFGKSSEVYLQNLIILPILGQMLHFYLDSQLWKFSKQYNRDNVLKYILKIIK